MEVVGHIKIGNTTKGLPTMSSKIHLTTTGKGGCENFEPYKDSNFNGYDRISVGVPFIKNVHKNFKVGKISFVLVNGIYKYRAEIENKHVILYPYQPYFENVLEDLPVIKLGLASKWESNLDMKIRAIGYFIIKDTVFDFKTSSAFSIKEISRALDILSKFEPKDVVNARLDLMFKTKLFKTNKVEEVSYLTISEITHRSFKDYSINNVPATVVQSIINVEEENLRLDSRTPLTMKAAQEFFNGKKITVELDREENNQFLEINNITSGDNDLVEKVENIESKKEALQDKKKNQLKKVSNNKEVFDKLIEAGLPNPIATALINIFENEAFNKAEELEFFMPNILKLISNNRV